MTRVFSALFAVFFAVAVSAQEETRTLPFNIELKKPITIEVATLFSQGQFSMEGRETLHLTPLKQDGEKVIYEAESVAAEFIGAEGVPPFLTELLSNLATEAVGLKYQFAADATGYPESLTKYKRIGSFMKKMGKGLKKWAKKFGKSEGLNEQQLAAMMGFVDQSIEPFLSDDPEVLGRLILEAGQLMFAPTGRELYVDYYTQYTGTRYFEEGEAYFHTLNNWSLDMYDEAAGEAVVSWEETLHPEEFEGFLTRYRSVLIDRNGPELADQIEEAVDKYRKLKLDRTAQYTIDLETGLVKDGTVRSEKVWEGSTEVEEMSFSMTQ